MRICFIISLAAHVSLLFFGYFANISTPESSEIEFSFSDVSIINVDEWVAISTPAPIPVEEPAQLSSIDVLDREVPAAPAIPNSQPIVEKPEIPQSAALSTAAPAVPTRPEFTVPSTPAPAPPPRMQAPEVVVPPAPPEPEEAPEAEDAAEQAAPKISSEAAPEPEPDVAQDEEVKVATSPDDSTDSTQEEVEESTAPEQAATKIVTEADEAEELPASAPIRRPTNLASRADSPNDPERRAEEPEAEEEAEADDSLNNATPDQTEIESLIAQTQLDQVESSDEAEQSTEPLLSPTDEGSPIPSSISEGLRRAIRDCWNVGSLSTAGMRTVLTVGFSLDISGVLRQETIKLVDAQSESEIATGRAFEAARRAIICGLAGGLDLPPESYSTWQNIEIRFDPEQMREK